jgi:hypothetical protein
VRKACPFIHLTHWTYVNFSKRDTSWLGIWLITVSNNFWGCLSCYSTNVTRLPIPTSFFTILLIGRILFQNKFNCQGPTIKFLGNEGVSRVHWSSFRGWLLRISSKRPPDFVRNSLCNNPVVKFQGCWNEWVPQDGCVRRMTDAPITGPSQLLSHHYRFYSIS